MSEKKQIEVILWKTFGGNLSAHQSNLDMSTGEYPWIQMSKPTVLEYEELPKGEIIKKQVDAIDNEIEAKRERVIREIEILENKKSELLAIPHNKEINPEDIEG